MYVLTSSEMRAMDRETIEGVGVPSRVLMERAGVSVVLAMEHELGDLRRYRFLVVVGGGNNGGDGLVVARNLLDYTGDVLVVLLKENLKGDPLENLKSYERIGGRYLTLGKDLDFGDFEKLLDGFDVVVDAMLGIGLKGKVRENVAKVIESLNASHAKKVCVDVPSGVDSDTGKILGTAVKCDLTVTFAYPKIGHVLYPGREYSGKLKVASIGIPKSLAKKFGVRRSIITEDLARDILPFRPKDSNKGTFGRVAVIGGSVLYKGAPVLSALGSMRSGAGLTYVFSPEGVQVCDHPEIISIPVKGCGGTFCEESFEDITGWLDKMDVLAIGPGMSLNEYTIDFVGKLIGVEKPMVIDADGLNAISRLGADVLKSRKSPTVLTPHPGEFARLLGMSVEDVKYGYELAEKFAKEENVVLVLKGATTIVTDGESTLFNLTGSSGLAKGGSGDVLTGVIASFMAQGLNAFEAAILGVYVHGRAAQLGDVGEYGLLASEVAVNISRVLSELRK